MLRLSWAIALIATLGTLTGILIVTRDLAVTNDIFKEGVVEAKKVNSTTDTALEAGTELPAAQSALQEGLPHVDGTLQALERAETTLASHAVELENLANVLGEAEAPLDGIIRSVDDATGAAVEATAPARNVTDTLTAANTRIRELDGMLHETLRRSERIADRMRALQRIPTVEDE